MERRTFLLLAGAIAFAAPAWAADPAPADIVTAVYRIYAGPKGDYSSGSFDDPQDCRLLFEIAARGDDGHGCALEEDRRADPRF